MVFTGTPILLFGEAGAAEESQIELSWQGGRLTVPINFGDSDIADTVWLLQGSRLITDWESRYPSEEALAPLEKRKQSRVATRLSTLSQTYELASREMSLVAVVTRPSDRPDELPETQVVRVGTPQDTAFGAYFQNQRVFKGTQAMVTASLTDTGSIQFSRSVSDAAPKAALSRLDRLFRRERFAQGHEPEKRLAEMPANSAGAAEDILLDLASRLDSDGGMPGKDRESRAVATAVALLAFLSQGHTATQGPFRLHIALEGS